MDQNPKYLSVGEVAKKLSVSESLVRRWIRELRLPAARLGALRAVRVAADDLDQFVARRPARRKPA